MKKKYFDALPVDLRLATKIRIISKRPFPFSDTSNNNSSSSCVNFDSSVVDESCQLLTRTDFSNVQQVLSHTFFEFNTFFDLVHVQRYLPVGNFEISWSLLPISWYSLHANVSSTWWDCPFERDPSKFDVIWQRSGWHDSFGVAQEFWPSVQLMEEWEEGFVLSMCSALHHSLHQDSEGGSRWHCFWLWRCLHRIERLLGA